jgi:protein phosphatase
VTIEATHSAKTDLGLKRKNNEDSYLGDPSLGLFVVCDGMGGGNAGEVASRLAVETIRAHVQETAKATDFPAQSSPSDFSPATAHLVDAVQTANHVVYQTSLENPAYAGMGTTVVAVRVTGQVLSIAHVGDSRAYLLRGKTIQPLTVDHSWVAEQVQQGLMSEAEAESSPKRNIVTRALGVGQTVDVDIAEMPLFRGDRLLLCSDGLTRHVRQQEILRTIQAHSDPDAAVDRLIRLANLAGGHDNSTVLLITIQPQKPARFWHRMFQQWHRDAS